jgi:hypothetical protein
MTVLLDAFNWLRKNPWAALALALGLAAGTQTVRLKLTQAELAMALADKVTLQAAIVEQNKAVDDWKARAATAEAAAVQARRQADIDRQEAQARAAALLGSAQKSIPCPEAWKRLIRALQGIRWRKP